MPRCLELMGLVPQRLDLAYRLCKVQTAYQTIGLIQCLHRGSPIPRWSEFREGLCRTPRMEKGTVPRLSRSKVMPLMKLGVLPCMKGSSSRFISLHQLRCQIATVVDNSVTLEK